jgi:hypothetical protein
VVYTLTAAPTNATVTLSGTPLNSGETFTQQDIADALVALTGGATYGSGFTFDFTVSNPGGPAGITYAATYDVAAVLILAGDTAARMRTPQSAL